MKKILFVYDALNFKQNAVSAKTAAVMKFVKQRYLNLNPDFILISLLARRSLSVTEMIVSVDFVLLVFFYEFYILVLIIKDNLVDNGLFRHIQVLIDRSRIHEVKSIFNSLQQERQILNSPISLDQRVIVLRLKVPKYWQNYQRSIVPIPCSVK